MKRQFLALHVQRGIEKADVDLLPAPCPSASLKRGEDSHRGQHRAVGVHHITPGGARVAAGAPGCPGQSAHGLRQQVLPWPIPVWSIRTVARAGAVDQPAIPAAHLFVAEAELLHGARPEILEEHVGRGHQPLDHRLGSGMLQVRGEAALVAIQREEERVHAPDPVEVEHPILIAAADPLDLDDIGAKVAEHLRAVRPLHEAGKVQHPYAVECASLCHPCLLSDRPRLTPQTRRRSRHESGSSCGTG